VKKLISILVVIFVLAALAVVILPGVTSEETCSYKEAVKRSAKGRFVSVHGKPVHYLEKGQGNPVILIHGYLHNTSAWKRNIDALADKFKVYALDLWGFGYSARLKKPEYSFKLYGDQVVGFMDALNIERASLAGHSMGGGVAVYTAAHYPDRVDKIILVGPAVVPHGETLTIKMYKLPFIGEFLNAIPGHALLKQTLRTCCFYDKERMPPDQVEMILAPLCIEGSSVAAMSVLRNVLREPFLMKEAKILATMDKPILLAHGKQDKLVPVAASQAVHELWKGSELVVFEKCGHNLNQEYPDKFNQLAVDFLGR